MGSKNQYIAQQAAALENPLNFAASSDSSTVTVANIDMVLDLLAQEGMDETDHRLFLYEMSPAARTSMYAIMLALKAATV